MFFFFFPSFSERLKELRTSNGLTMEQLGKEIESTRGTIGNFENGNKKPSLDMLIKLADYFDVSIDYLVGRTDDPKLHQKEDWYIFSPHFLFHMKLRIYFHFYTLLISIPFSYSLQVSSLGISDPTISFAS